MFGSFVRFVLCVVVFLLLIVFVVKLLMLQNKQTIFHCNKFNVLELDLFM